METRSLKENTDGKETNGIYYYTNNVKQYEGEFEMEFYKGTYYYTNGNKSLKEKYQKMM